MTHKYNVNRLRLQDMTPEELEEYELALERESYQDDPEREAGETFQDRYDMYRNEH